MEIDWSQVKKITLWHYEDLIKKLLEVLNYGFVQLFYNHSMAQAVLHAAQIQNGYQQNRSGSAYIDEISGHFQRLDMLGIRDYLGLVHRVETKEKCEAYLQDTGFGLDALIQVLNYLFRWVLPFRCPVKEILDTLPQVDSSHLQILKKYKIRSNLDVIENFHTRSGRQHFSEKTGMPEGFLLALLYRADLSRLAYVRSKTIKHLCGGGYNTLEKLAAADIQRIEADMSTYYESIGWKFSDFQAVIPLAWMIGGARILPKVVENHE